MKHALEVHTTFPVQSSERLQNLVGDLNKLLFGELNVLRFFGTVNVHEAGIVCFRDHIDLPSFRAQHSIFATVDDLTEIVAAPQRLRQLEEAKPHDLCIQAA